MSCPSATIARLSAGLVMLASGVVVAQPTGHPFVVTVDVGGGWTRSGYSHGGSFEALSGPALGVQVGLGFRTGFVDAGLTGGGLEAGRFRNPGIDNSGIDDLLLGHAGGFVSFRVPAATRFAIRTRLELAHVQLSGTPFIADGPQIHQVIASGNGGLLGVGASYALLPGPRVSLTVGIEAFGGVLWKGNDPGVDAHVVPFGMFASVGVFWLPL